MDNQKTIILLLLVIILLLLVIVGIMFSNSMGKEKSQLTISDKTLFEGDSLVVMLTDNRGLPIANATVNVKLTDEDGITIDEEVKTNLKGEAALKVDEKGNYSLEATFDGQGKYDSSSISDNIEVKKIATESVSQNDADTNSHQSYSPYFGSYRIVETHDELALVETADGGYYVFAGDGAYTFEGYDSNGNIKLGSYVGKY